MCVTAPGAASFRWPLFNLCSKSKEGGKRIRNKETELWWAEPNTGTAGQNPSPELSPKPRESPAQPQEPGRLQPSSTPWLCAGLTSSKALKQCGKGPQALRTAARIPLKQKDTIGRGGHRSFNAVYTLNQIQCVSNVTVCYFQEQPRAGRRPK